MKIRLPKRKARDISKHIGKRPLRWIVEEMKKLPFHKKLIELTGTPFRANMFWGYQWSRLYPTIRFGQFGECFRFVIYPSREEYKKSPEIIPPFKYRGHGSGDITRQVGGGIGYFGINIQRCKGEERPTAFINVVTARRGYYELTSSLKRRSKNWDEKGLKFLEEKLKKMGFKRITILPSTDVLFTRPTLSKLGKLPRSVVKKYYEQLPESQGYVKKQLVIKFRNPFNEREIEEREYYVKELN